MEIEKIELNEPLSLLLKYSLICALIIGVYNVWVKVTDS